MQRTTLGIVLAVAVCVLLLPEVGVGDVIVDPDAYAAGTVLNTLYPGVTLSTVMSNTGASANVYAVADSLASTSPNVFGHDDGFPPSWTFTQQAGFGWGVLRADFAPGATAVSIDVIGNDPTDYGRLEAYDSSNVLLGSATSGLLGTGSVQTLSLSGIGTIAYIRAGGDAQLGDTCYLDNLHYTPVPVPAALPLGILGLAGLGVLGRKMRKRA